MHIFDPEEMDSVFSALASASRRQLLDALHRDNGQTLLALCSTLDMSRQAASKHLALLEEAGLVVTLWRGREKLHYLNPVPLESIYERWIRKFEEKRLEALFALKTTLEKDKERGRGRF